MYYIFKTYIIITYIPTNAIIYLKTSPLYKLSKVEETFFSSSSLYTFLIYLSILSLFFEYYTYTYNLLNEV